VVDHSSRLLKPTHAPAGVQPGRRLAELELIDHIERVAAMPRSLPMDTVVEDYHFVDVASGNPVRLSELFSAPDRALIVYYLM
jgi:predicted dithiol-disulfide oxidoreductase (DUF899 family)